MTPAAMVPMRLAATVAHALPGVRLRLRQGDRLLLEVTRTSDRCAPVVSPCAFRNAVARAHQQLAAGHRLRFLELDEGETAAIDIAVTAPDEIRPGGVYRIAVGEGALLAFATTLAPRACRAIVAKVLDDAPRLALHHDAATDITVVHTTGTAADDEAAALQEVLVRCAAEELVHELATVAPLHRR